MSCLALSRNVLRVPEIFIEYTDLTEEVDLLKYIRE
jgi:hypothetical protein